MLKYDQKYNFFSSTLINDDKYLAAFGTRDFVNARYYEEGYRQFKKKDISQKYFAIPDQTHSSNITIITSPDKKFIHPLKTDGLITSLSDCVLTVRSADCLPVIYVDKRTNLIGISHQGWKGSLEQMVVRMIKKMEELGSKKQNISIAIGPAIGACCYEIYGERYDIFKKTFAQFTEDFFEYNSKKTYLNLLKLTYLQLLSYNINREQIEWFPFCTSCDNQRFYSYQRDRKEEYGEMLSFVVKY